MQMRLQPPFLNGEGLTLPLIFTWLNMPQTSEENTCKNGKLPCILIRIFLASGEFDFLIIIKGLAVYRRT